MVRKSLDGVTAEMLKRDMIKSKRNLEIQKFIADKFLPFFKEVGEGDFPFMTAVRVVRRFKVYSPFTSDVDVRYSIRNHLRRLATSEAAQIIVAKEKNSARLCAACGLEEHE